MPEFAEYKPGETNTRSNDVAGKKKKTIKNKWFFVALAGVVILVIIQKLRKTKEDESGYYSVPLGYSGYPETTGGAVVADNSDVYDALDDLAGQFDTAIGDIYKENENNIKNLVDEMDFNNKQADIVIDEVTSQLDITNKKYDDIVDKVERQTEQINVQNIITQMKENSDKALISNSESEKEYLHNLNMQLADKIGATYNETDGYYYKNGQRIYSTPLQSSKAASNALTSAPSNSISSAPSSGSVINRDDVISKMKANSMAYAGADTTTQNNLYLENQDYGKSIGLTYDANSGKWKTPTGEDAWDYSETHATTTAAGSVDVEKNNSISGDSDYYQRHEVFDIGGFSSPVVIPKTTTETSAPTTNTKKPAWLDVADEQVEKINKKTGTKTGTGTKGNTKTKTGTKNKTKTTTPRNTLDVNKSSFNKVTGFKPGG